MKQSILGIDIAKNKFDVILLKNEKQCHRIFSNCSEGFEQLSAWLFKQEVDKVHACLEVTGTYGEALGTYLYQTGHQVSMVNPFCIQAFGQSQLTRNKTDKVDAKIIALYCQSQLARALGEETSPSSLVKIPNFGRLYPLKSESYKL